MKSRQLEKALSSCLAVILLVSVFITSPGIAVDSIAAPAASISQQKIYTSATTWAKPEIEKAYQYGIIPSRLLPLDGPKPATREELCELSVLLYEAVTGKKADPAPNPFTDTSNTEILKAYKLGITSGTSADTFSPDSITNREQVAAMFGRAILVMFPNDDYSIKDAPVFSDQTLISSWALEHVKFMSKTGILTGAGGKFMPKAVTDAQKASGYGTTKREEAIAIAVRIYEKYKLGGVLGDKEKATISFIRTAKPTLSEIENFAKIDFNNRLFRPVHKPKITLMAADGFSSSGTPIYSSAPFSAFIRSDGNKTESFKISLPADVLSQTSQIVWQVLVAPPDGSPVNVISTKPGGLLLSGTLSKQTKEFTIDFSKVVKADNTLRNLKQSTIKAGTSVGLIDFNPPDINLPDLNQPDIDLPDLEIPDLNKNLWDFSRLLSTPYSQESTTPRTYYVRAYPVDGFGNSIGDTGNGLPVIYGDPMTAPNIKAALFSLKPAKLPGTVHYVGEFPNNFSNATEATFTTADSPKSYSVLPAGFPVGTQELKVQVSLADYSSTSGDSWRNTPGLVYEKSIFPNDPAFKALSGDKPPGIAIDFTQIVPDDSEMPDEKRIPYYVRVAAFTDGSQTGAVNVSYSKTVTIYYSKAQTTDNLFLEQIKITPNMPQVTSVSYTPVDWETYGWQYHYVVIRQPSMKDVFGSFFGNDPYPPYKVGTKLDLTPQPENKSWWEEAWDAITDFFSDLAGFFSDVVNWVSKAYADLKSGLINFVVSALPSSWQGPLAKALTALVDYGLASMGIPPTLPNFNELSDMGVDYLATVAMEQAGVPAEDIVKYGVDELADGIKKNADDAAKSASPNPLNWNFIKHDPEDLYKPAYIMVELYNPSATESTPPGKLSCTVDKQMDMTKNGTDSAITRLYAAYGNPRVTLYKPVFGMTIPALAPRQRLSVPIFLEEYIGVPFSSGGMPVAPSDFNIMYGGLGAFDFNINIQYDLPSVIEEAKKQGYTKEAIYSYSALGNGRSFSVLPGESYDK